MTRPEVREIRDVRRKVARAAQGVTWMSAKVLSVNPLSQTATVRIGDPDTEFYTDVPNVPLQGGFVPDVGHDVGVQLVGNAAVVAPPGTLSQVTQRGRFDSVGGDNALDNGDMEEFWENLIPNAGFEFDISNFSPGGNTTIAQSGTQKYAGNYSCALTCTVTNGTPSVYVKAGTAGSMGRMVPVKAGYRYMVEAQVRAGSTGRAPSFHVVWYDDAGATISTSDGGGLTGDSSSAWTLVGDQFTAPVGATWAAPGIWFGLANVANGEIHYVDNFLMHECVPGWDSSTSAKTYTFDGGTDGWGDPFFGSATVVQYTGGDPPPLAGAGSLQVTASVTGGVSVFGPTGTSGIPTTPGYRVVATIWVRPHAAAVHNVLGTGVDFYNSSGAYISGSSTVTATCPYSSWTPLSVDTTAPAGAAYYALKFLVGSPTTVGEIWYVDAAYGTIPPNAALVQAYSGFTPQYVRSGQYSMSLRCIATGVANVQAPPGDLPGTTTPNAIPVSAGDYWDIDFWYKNDSGNGTKRGMLAVAIWYDASGNMIANSIGTFPTTTPGSGWIHGHETFIVPGGSTAYMRISLALLGNAGDIVYVDDVTVKRNSIMRSKVVPEGSIENVGMRANLQPLVISSLFVSAGTWSVSPTYVFPNPNTPIQFEVVFTGASEKTSDTNSPLVDVRVGISFDNGTTWSYGPVTRYLMYNPGAPLSAIYYAVNGAHQLTGMPTADVKYRLEINSNINNTPNIKNGSFLLKVLPAPPAGSF